MVSKHTATIPTSSASKRQWQLLLSLVVMLAISSPHYTWAVFSTSFIDILDVKVSELSITMTIFSVCMLGLGPLHGYLLQRMDVRVYVAIGGLLVGLGWSLSAFATNLLTLYLTYGVICGVGIGMVYIAGMDLAAQWFPDRRGLALGVTSAGYSFGAMMSTFPITISLAEKGLVGTLVVGGIVVGTVIVAAALGMRKRRDHDWVPAAPAVAQVSTRSFTPGEMLRTPSYWLLFLMMTLVATGGMMVIAQMGHFAPSFGITPDVMVWGVAALPLALTVDRFANGITRPLFGWISDHLGRENTMAFAFAMEGLSIYALLIWGHDPVWFVVLTAIVFLGWGEIFSLFPATQADMFGPRHQANNLGFLLISIAVASVFGGPLAGLIYEATGSWTPVFVIVSGLDLLAAGLAIFVLKPMRVRSGMEGGDASAISDATAV
jgi:oxalate/formate antiporter